ncbi:MAG: WecB/TagA/CpsF family glycosyltransferase [Lachnospiraceae bacterium]
MIKKIELLGTEIDNYSVRESMLLVETYLNNNVMNTIESISMKMLVGAGENPKIKEAIESLDLALPGEKDILFAADVTSSQRIKEIADNMFFQEFAKRIIRNRKNVFLLGETHAQVERLQGFLEEFYEKMNIVGEYAMEDCVGDIAGTINEINIVSPDIIFSVVPSPKQEEFLMEQKEKIGAKLWYGLGDNYMQRTGFDRLYDGIHKMARRAVFHSKLTKYKKER